MTDLNLSRASVERTWRWLRWRSGLLVIVFFCGLAAMMMGVGVSDRPDLVERGVLAKAYYTMGLFVLGGLDLGVPVGGPPMARALLWLTYFSAPAITASALIEGFLRAIRPRSWALERIQGHVVVAGAGKLAMEFLSRIRILYPTKPLVVVEQRVDAPSLDEARDVYGAYLITGDISSDVLLRALRLGHADRVLLLTGDDFANLDAAAKILQIDPSLGKKMLVHVSDLNFMRVLAHTKLSEDCTVFNTHQIAARHLVKTRLLEHFQRSEPLDTVIIAGFGRFGQTVLDALQTLAVGSFDRLIVVDVECDRRAEVFAEQVGFVGDYTREVINGDLRDPELWRDLESRFDLSQGEPAIVVGSSDDGTNIRTALSLQKKYPNAYVVARGFRRSTFASEVSREGGFDVFSVAELLSESIPVEWLD
jgi:voltage-gated potassium channel Kch